MKDNDNDDDDDGEMWKLCNYDDDNNSRPIEWVVWVQYLN